ncbi:MAG TPA: ABC transporter permease [Thermoanaerobaculia bacterium]|nr:ABC transporter permease [Thermoanaerobaculia bacterium]
MSRFLVRLIRLFPADFRRQFGEEIADQIRRDDQRARSRGRLAAIWYGFSQTFDLARAALGERWRPTWTEPRAPRAISAPRKDTSMRTDAWIHDLRYAVRALRRSPGFVVVSVVTLGLAIGVNAGLFSVIDTVLLNPLPYRDTDRLVRISASAPGSDLPAEFGVSAEFFVQYREQSELLDGIAIYNSFTNTLRADDRTERVRMSTPSPSLFATLGVSPILGRLPVEEDEDRVVVISHALWKTWFGSDRDVLGRTLYAGGADRTVIGVMGPEFWFPDDGTLLWIPAVVRAEDIVPGRFGLPLVARVAPGVSREALVEELDRLALRLPDRFTVPARYAELIDQHRAIVRPLEEELLGGVSGPLWVLFGAMGIVLLIACANVANLVLVRTERRHRDLAVQRAIGAGRGQLVRSQMAEALVLGVLGGAVALLLAWALVPLLVQAAPAEIPRLAQVAIGPATLLFTLAAALLSALLCGLFPAIRASAPKLAHLREGGRGATRRRHWVRGALVVGQSALALVLLIGSGLLVRSFWELREVDPGYDLEDLFSFQIAPEGSHLTDPSSFARFHLGFMERLAALPGVETVGLIENLPLDEGLSAASFATDSAERETDATVRSSFTWAAGDYFRAMGIELLAGRTFVEADHVSDLGHVVVSESAANALWPGEDAVGRRLRRQELEVWETVVGVVEDVMQYSFRDVPEPLVYYPLVGQPGSGARPISSPAYVLKTARADDIAPEVRALVREDAPGAPMYRVYTMEGLASDSMVQLSFTMLALGLASALALILGAIGLYGVLSQVVAERTQEIGVRMALGAAPRRVQLMVLAQGVQVLALGLVLGIAAASGLTRVLESLLYEVAAVDVATFVWMSAAMAAMGLLATYLPARRAATVDPIESLRES